MAQEAIGLQLSLFPGDEEEIFPGQSALFEEEDFEAATKIPEELPGQLELDLFN